MNSFSSLTIIPCSCLEHYSTEQYISVLWTNCVFYLTALTFDLFPISVRPVSITGVIDDANFKRFRRRKNWAKQIKHFIAYFDLHECEKHYAVKSDSVSQNNQLVAPLRDLTRPPEKKMICLEFPLWTFVHEYSWRVSIIITL